MRTITEAEAGGNEIGQNETRSVIMSDRYEDREEKEVKEEEGEKHRETRNEEERRRNVDVEGKRREEK